MVEGGVTESHAPTDHSDGLESQIGDVVWNGFSDAVSRVQFDHHISNLSCSRAIASSWDGCLRGIDLQKNDSQCTLVQGHRPLLSCCFVNRDGGSAPQSVFAGLEGVVFHVDHETKTVTSLGSHDDAVRCVEYSNDYGMIVSGSWDSTLKGWDNRASGKPLFKCDQPNKIFAMDILDHKNRLIVAHAGRTVNIYDLRRMEQPSEKRKPLLDYQIRDIKLFPDGRGFALACIAGRVAVDYFDGESGAGNMFKFKCHRSAESIFPVNSLAFHPECGTFVTGGGDNTVSAWDPGNQRRLTVFPTFPNPISSLDFNCDGSVLAIGVSSSFVDEGKLDVENGNCVYLKKLRKSDMLPRQKKAKA